jgi:hypothetical protein
MNEISLTHNSPLTPLLPFWVKNFIMIFDSANSGFMNFVADLRTLLLALWLGAALFFSFAVAQSAFAVLPSRELAGSVVNRTLAIVNYSGLVIGLFLLVSSFISRKGVNRKRLWAEQILLSLLSAACFVGQFVIGARLHSLREQMSGPIDQLAADDPLRVAFNSLHGYSVIILLAAMIAAMIAFFLLASRVRNNKFR